jgi:hypothetical protein
VGFDEPGAAKKGDGSFAPAHETGEVGQGPVKRLWLLGCWVRSGLLHTMADWGCRSVATGCFVGRVRRVGHADASDV